MTRGLVAVALFACACGDTGVVDVVVPGTPSYIAYRDSRGVWLTPDRVDGAWRLAVHDDYELWTVCTAPDGSFSVQGLRATLDDGDTQHLDPWFGIAGCEDPDPDVAPVSVIGAMLQAGTINTCSGMQTSLSPVGWEFRLDGLAGRCDLIATDYDRTRTLAATHIVWRKLELAGDFDAGAFDVFGGLPLQPMSVPITGTPVGATLFGSVWLSSGRTVAEIAGLPGGTQMLTVPLVPDEYGHEYASAYAYGGGVTQTAQVAVEHGMPPIEMLAPAPAEWLESTRSITWRAIETRHTTVELSLVGEQCATCPIRSQRVVATQRWLDAHRDHELGFATNLPGYDPAWQIDTARPYSASFTLRADEGPNGYLATVQLH